MIPAILTAREKEERRREIQSSFLDLQSFVGRNSSCQERKFIYLTRATHGVMIKLCYVISICQTSGIATPELFSPRQRRQKFIMIIMYDVISICQTSSTAT